MYQEEKCILSDELRRRLAQIRQLHPAVHPSERDLLKRLDHILAPQLLFLHRVPPFCFLFSPEPRRTRFVAQSYARAQNFARKKMPQYLRQRKREGHLFSKRDAPPLNPPRENFTLVASGSNGLYASGMKMPAR